MSSSRSNGIKLFGVWLQKPEPIDKISEEASTESAESSNHSRNKPKQWTREEHRLFLIGLEKLGKGNWKEISRKFVLTRTPTQVASHAQKYFMRLAGANGRKRRRSLFDMQVDHIPFTDLQEEREGKKRFIGSSSNKGEEDLSYSESNTMEYNLDPSIINPKP